MPSQPTVTCSGVRLQLSESGHHDAAPSCHAAPERLALARELKKRTAWGTDILFTPQNLHTHGKQLAKLTQIYAPLELLQIATANNGELCQMAGARSPYPGKLGVIEAGAWADLLVVDADPSQSLAFLETPETSLQLIMKNGVIHKNLLSA